MLVPSRFVVDVDRERTRQAGAAQSLPRGPCRLRAGGRIYPDTEVRHEELENDGRVGVFGLGDGASRDRLRDQPQPRWRGRRRRSRCGASDVAADSTAADASADVAADASVDAGAKDAGATDAGGVVDGGGTADASSSDAASTCGAVTTLGSCAGSVLTWCEAGKVSSLDCAKQFGPSQVGVCTEISKDYGVVCAAKPGETCVFLNDEDDLEQEYCQGNKAACVFDGADDVCKADVGTCTEETVDTCVGDYLVWACLEPQPAVYACAAFGATCGKKGTENVCLNAKLDNSCDDLIVFCAADLVCKGATDTDYGKCVKK